MQKQNCKDENRNTNQNDSDNSKKNKTIMCKDILCFNFIKLGLKDEKCRNTSIMCIILDIFFFFALFCFVSICLK